MRSGCPHSQGGAYPAFQHWSNVGALTSPQDNNVTSVPVVHSANGIQNNMIATQYPGELRVAYGPAQWQQGNTQSRQNVQGLHHQLESQASIASTGFHYPKPGNTALGPGLQQRHLKRVFSAGTSSAALQGDGLGVAAQTFPLQDQCSSVPERKWQKSCPLLHGLLEGNPPKSFFTTPSFSSEETNANIELNTSTHFSDERHCKSQPVKSSLAALNCGQTRTQNLVNSGGTYSTPYQQQVSSPSLSGQPSTVKVSPVGEIVPLTDDQIHDLIAKKLAYFRTILSQKKHTHSNNDSALQSDCIMPKSNSVSHLPTTSASHKEDVERQSLNCAVIEQCTAAVGQAVEVDSSKGSKANAELTPKSKETGDCAKSASEKHSTGTLVSAVGNSKHAVEKSASVDLDLPVKKHLDVTMSVNADGKLVYSDDCEDKTFVGSNDESFHSKWCDKYLENGMTTLHYSLTALKELIASLENVETIAKMDNFSEVILQQYWNGDIDNIHLFTSTEYPEILMNVAATCTKNEDESPVVLTAVSGMTLDELTEKHPSLTLNCSASQEEYKSLWLNINKTLDDIDQVPSKLSSSPDKIQIHNVVSRPTNQSEWLCKQTSHEDAGEDVGSVHSQTDLSIELSEKKVKEHAPLSESKGEEAHSVNILKDPQYEDISDDEDVSQLATKLPNTEHEELSFPACFENPQIENMAVERPSLTQVPEPNNKQSPFENEGYRHVQGQAQMKTEIISDEELIPKEQVSPKTETLDIAQHCSCPRFVETDGGFEGLLCPKCDRKRPLGWQTNHSVSCSPSSVLEDEDETDDQMDDDWIVIPISMSDLKFEPEDEDQDGPEKVVLDDGETGDKERQSDTNPTHCVLHWPAPKPVAASASSQIPVFDTVESFLQAVKFKNKVASGWSTPEHEMDSEEEPHTTQNRRESYFEPEDSCETEDSCDYSSGSEHNYLTVSRQLLKKKSAPLPPETDDPVSEKEGEDDEVTNVQKGQTRSLDKLGYMQKLRQLIETKAGSKHVQHKTNAQKISKNDDIIIINSDTDDDESDQNCKKKAKRKRLVFSGSEDSGDAPSRQQKRHSPETVDSRCGTIKEKLAETRLSSADSSLPQHQSKLHDTQFKEVMHLSHSVKKTGQLIEAKGGSEQVQHKTNRQTMSDKERIVFHDSGKVVKKDHFSKNRANTKRILPSGSEDSDNAVFATKNRPSTETEDRLCGTANKKPKKPRLLSEDSPKKEPESVDKETDSSLGPNPVIPRLVVVESSPPNHNLKLLKESRVHMQGKDETRAPKTPTATSEKTDSCEKNTQHWHRNKKGRFVSKPKPANDGHHATKNKVQANIAKPRLVSSQLSLPNQEGPSNSISSSSTSGQLSEARQSSASSGGLSQSGETSASFSLPKSKQSTSIPRHLSPSIQRSHSYSNPSTLDHPYTPTKGPSSSATMQSSARTQLIKDWQKSFFPTRRDRKSSLGMEKDLKTTNYDSWREAGPQPSHYDRAPRQRHNSHKSATPLMKKTKSDAIQWTKAINQDTPRKQRYSVGEGYKWSEKPTKGYGRERK